MRVVNADKLIEKIVSNFPYKLDIKQYESIWGVPIIEAIPIEWIEEYMNKQPKTLEYGFYFKTAETVAMENMLNEWRKENGRKKNDRQDNNTL